MAWIRQEITQPACAPVIGQAEAQKSRFVAGVMVKQVNARFSEVMSSQFRPIEVAALEKRQRHFKKPGLVRLEFEFLPTVRSGAGCFELPLILSTFGLLSHDNPTSTFWASDARGRNAISHSKIILRSWS